MNYCMHFICHQNHQCFCHIWCFTSLGAMILIKLACALAMNLLTWLQSLDRQLKYNKPLWTILWNVALNVMMWCDTIWDLVVRGQFASAATWASLNPWVCITLMTYSSLGSNSLTRFWVCFLKLCHLLVKSREAKVGIPLFLPGLKVSPPVWHVSYTGWRAVCSAM